ncbi:cysteine hydrolase [Rhodococcus sp. ABRD24]|uniref:cysteine hydrolase family protein n=1 Tax=Rhodococcus sp. ABRD24 TaxID=2507582 RepID=UPI0010396453|nr:isochorismatase family cysteine hydrolase [Rhodococcus sp. ABRD24]QBJ94760.1 cysteine hydrolase [Rhodococcus sp. ABRD24]
MTDAFDGLDEYLRPHLGSSALLVIDMQNDFTDDGPLPVPGTDRVLPRLTELVEAYRNSSKPIVHVVRLYDGDDVDLVRRTAIARDNAAIARPGSRGSQIVDGLLPRDAPRLDSELLLGGALQPVGAHEAVLWKPRWSAFHRTGLDAHLAALKVDTVVVAGCNFPNCPRATLFDASERDYRLVLAADATSQATPDRLADAQSIGVVPMPVIDLIEHVRAC